MTEGALLYYEEVRERTELARHALRRKCAPNVVRFNRYTRAEQKRLNGPVRTYQNRDLPCR